MVIEVRTQHAVFLLWLFKDVTSFSFDSAEDEDGKSYPYSPTPEKMNFVSLGVNYWIENQKWRNSCKKW